MLTDSWRSKLADSGAVDQTGAAGTTHKTERIKRDQASNHVLQRNDHRMALRVENASRSLPRLAMTNPLQLSS